MNKQKLYTILILACFTGYAWLYWSNANTSVPMPAFDVCIFKAVTSIPCPSCGSTRSVLSLLHGNFGQALYWNPLGYIGALIMIIAPIWISYDCFYDKSSFYNFYNKIELVLQRKKVAIPTIILVLVNWLWNIYKGL